MHNTKLRIYCILIDCFFFVLFFISFKFWVKCINLVKILFFLNLQKGKRDDWQSQAKEPEHGKENIISYSCMYELINY